MVSLMQGQAISAEEMGESHEVGKEQESQSRVLQANKKDTPFLFSSLRGQYRAGEIHVLSSRETWCA